MTEGAGELPTTTGLMPTPPIPPPPAMRVTLPGWGGLVDTRVEPAAAAMGAGWEEVSGMGVSMPGRPLSLTLLGLIRWAWPGDWWGSMAGPSPLGGIPSPGDSVTPPPGVWGRFPPTPSTPPGERWPPTAGTGVPKAGKLERGRVGMTPAAESVTGMARRVICSTSSSIALSPSLESDVSMLALSRKESEWCEMWVVIEGELPLTLCCGCITPPLTPPPPLPSRMYAWNADIDPWLAAGGENWGRMAPCMGWGGTIPSGGLPGGLALAAKLLLPP
eukprot:CAMPEP_0202861780 /NCGR_PEP_ID=MMETSP1391-20130828/3062_1 /ASSEMBLY_ACC=CAM_ASM_000867 /TAXON_ID=1034604 /ORGANISM="Chlamydomonas leiostraca, Strain SAG 11-49" /LENGTH=274 /DNA_ID=CAMNT_0049541217 /DNA_START=147 /DNA_END=968 /DNA_ORIENTATION=+